MSQFIKTQEAGTLQSLGWARNIKFSRAVTWCTIPTINLSQPVGAYTYYDENEDRCEGLSLCYQAAVLLVDVPCWDGGKRKGLDHADSAAASKSQESSEDEGDILFWRKDGESDSDPDY